MPQPDNEHNHPIPGDLLAEPAIDDDCYGDPETTAPERDDDPAAEDDFPVPFVSKRKTD